VPLKELPYREVKRRLEAVGFIEHSQKGSHVKFVKTAGDKVITAIVPNHRVVAVGTLRSILRQAGIGIGEWDTL
jgi:predicted RNA binding protein YcfA (HicA-like mRNA interferase family)